jgi:Domain of unknown function (DUF4271)
MRFIALCLLFLLSGFSGVYARQDSVAGRPQYHADTNAAQQPHMAFLDSVALATTQRQQFVTDSLATMYIMPDPNRPNLLTAYIMKNELYTGHTFLDIPFVSKRKLGDGHTRKSRDPWVIVMIGCLLLYTALLNFSLGPDLKNVFQSLYNKRAAQFDKDDRHINAWAFIGLFVLFGLTFGLFLYQLAAYKNQYYSISGVQLFMALSLIIIALFSVKFVVLKLIGFLFDIDNVVGEYITTLYLTYFNIAFVFLPVVVCFSLLAAQFIPVLLLIALFLIVVIFVWIYLRSSVNIISNFRFHKFYLFIYLCALEICPILILIKVLSL